MNGWAAPLVTGHKYKIHWGMTGLDFEGMTATVSRKWQETDKPIYFVQNFTDVREAITVKWKGQEILNDTIGANKNDWSPGQNLVFN